MPAGWRYFDAKETAEVSLGSRKSGDLAARYAWPRDLQVARSPFTAWRRAWEKIRHQIPVNARIILFFIGAIAGVSKVILLDKVNQLAVRLV
jgi:hypothetical protein